MQKGGRPMERTTDELIRIALAGGGFTIDARNYTTDELVQIAIAASNLGSRIRILNTNWMETEELIEIAIASKGCVTFES